LYRLSQLLEEIKNNGGYTTLFHNEDFFFPSDTKFRESSEVLIQTTDINPINEDVIISDEG
jgi:hypothetical protein